MIQGGLNFVDRAFPQRSNIPGKIIDFFDAYRLIQRFYDGSMA